MPSASSILFYGLVALFFWTAVGFPLARRLFPAELGLAFAPVIGWAVHSAIALPVLRAFGAGIPVVAGCAIAVLLGAILLCPPARAPFGGPTLPIPWFAFALAALAALVPTLAVMPKTGADIVTLSPPIFDHAKVALIDEIARNGLPPVNPFYGPTDLPLAYYYLWHFSAAEMVRVFGVTGWEADAALTGVTAFASMSVMIGLAGKFGGTRSAWLVPPLAFAGSLRPTLEFFLGEQAVHDTLRYQTGLAGWLFQTAWAPQHVMSAACLLVAVLLLVEMARQPSPPGAAILALMAAALFQSSIWVGILFAATAPLVGLFLIADAPAQRRNFALLSTLAGGAAIVLAFPLLRDQVVNAAARLGGRAISFHAYEVFSLPEDVFPTRVLDIPGFWLVQLLVEFPAIYLTGLAGLAAIAFSRQHQAGARTAARAFGIVLAASLTFAAYFTITFSDNNDLGWRAALPGIFLLVVFAATIISHWFMQRRFALAGALLLLIAALPQSLAWTQEYISGQPSSSDRGFASTPALWNAVRRHTGPTERVANNPMFMAKMTPWSINISWALLADRRSCFAGSDYLTPFTTLTQAQQIETAEFFQRIFAGEASDSDLQVLTHRYRCDVVVLTPHDGAWERDPFIASTAFAQVEKADDWRIYRATAGAK